MKIIPDYHPPADYRRPTKTQEKVYVPVNDYPEINFSEITNPVLTLPRTHCHVLKNIHIHLMKILFCHFLSSLAHSFCSLC